MKTIMICQYKLSNKNIDDLFTRITNKNMPLKDKLKHMLDQENKKQENKKSKTSKKNTKRKANQK